jgi:hypothetical protein
VRRFMTPLRPPSYDDLQATDVPDEWRRYSMERQ